jgi:Xaa-Pro dipeptidase
MSAYTEHVSTIQQRWAAALTAKSFDAALIAAGSRQNYFLDDQAPPFRANPHFSQWLESGGCEHALLIVRPGQKPRLFFHQPRDYWHQPPALPNVEDAIEVLVFETPDALVDAACRSLERDNRVALVGETGGTPSNLPVADVNPQQLLNQIHYGRAYKTGFELDCMRHATATAILGHRAARRAFFAGASEYEIHQAYLRASRQTDAELPYSSIVALNQHAGVLHYQHYDREAPLQRHSFLIDAGARAHGYASDITRTYADDAGSDFAALIDALDEQQQALISRIRPGVNYLELHESMHRTIGDLLAQFGFVTCSGDEAFETGITDAFLPHGLGHLIGLQTHDVAGHMVSPEGGLRPPPERYPALRLTRDVEVGQVFTIEPGLYFIPLLLDSLRSTQAGDRVNWRAVESFLPCGGIRIEDNVLVTRAGTVNLTRDAFAAADAQ